MVKSSFSDCTPEAYNFSRYNWVMLPIWLILICLLLLGWLCGMLVNYLADVLPAEASLKRLTCPVCQAPQKLHKAILRLGACPRCGRARPWRVWAVLLLFTLVVPASWLFPPPGMNFGLVSLVLVYFGVVAVVDIEHRMILFVANLCGLVLGVWVGWQRVGLAGSLVGGALAGLWLLLIYLMGIAFSKLLSGLRGRGLAETVFGFGDVILGTGIGLMLGSADALRGMLYTFILAGAGSLFYLTYLLLSHRYRFGTVIPFSVFLVCSALMLLCLKI